eukprot:6045-Heterococcus_DN1.PRE.2
MSSYLYISTANNLVETCAAAYAYCTVVFSSTTACQLCQCQSKYVLLARDSIACTPRSYRPLQAHFQDSSAATLAFVLQPKAQAASFKAQLDACNVQHKYQAAIAHHFTRNSELLTVELDSTALQCACSSGTDVLCSLCHAHVQQANSKNVELTAEVAMITAREQSVVSTVSCTIRTRTYRRKCSHKSANVAAVYAMCNTLKTEKAQLSALLVDTTVREQSAVAVASAERARADALEAQVLSTALANTALVVTYTIQSRNFKQAQSTLTNVAAVYIFYIVKLLAVDVLSRQLASVKAELTAEVVAITAREQSAVAVSSAASARADDLEAQLASVKAELTAQLADSTAREQSTAAVASAASARADALEAQLLEERAAAGCQKAADAKAYADLQGTYNSTVTELVEKKAEYAPSDSPSVRTEPANVCRSSL